ALRLSQRRRLLRLAARTVRQGGQRRLHPARVRRRHRLRERREEAARAARRARAAGANREVDSKGSDMTQALSPLAKEKLRELSSSAANPAVVDELARIMAEGSDLDGYKINAFRLGDALKVPRPEAVRSLLFAARLGLL